MKDKLFGGNEFEILKTCRIKFYIDKEGKPYPVQKLTCSDKVFRPIEFERNTNKRFSAGSAESATIENKKATADTEGAIRRAKKNIYDLIRCNHFVWFCTLTFDSEKVNREDYKEVIKRFNQWADNRVRRNGLKYVAVVERHKKSNGLHFHLVCNDVINLVDSGTVSCVGRKRPIKTATADKYNIPQTDRKTVYNIKDWGYGFSTAIHITGDDKGLRVAGYLRKYLTKDFEKIGGRYYYSGGELKRPMYVYVDDDYKETEYDWEFTAGGKAYRGFNLEK